MKSGTNAWYVFLHRDIKYVNLNQVVNSLSQLLSFPRNIAVCALCETAFEVLTNRRTSCRIDRSRAKCQEVYQEIDNSASGSCAEGVECTS